MHTVGNSDTSDNDIKSSYHTDKHIYNITRVSDMDMINGDCINTQLNNSQSDITNSDVTPRLMTHLIEVKEVPSQQFRMTGNVVSGRTVTSNVTHDTPKEQESQCAILQKKTLTMNNDQQKLQDETYNI